jgi:ketosteroid isomerase-like protein
MPIRSVLRAAALSLTLLAPTCLPAQAPASLHTATQQELDVVKVLLKQEAAWNKGDIDGFAEGYKDSPDTLFINRTISRGFDGMRAEYHQNYPTRASMGTLVFSELEVHRLDDTFALCLGKYHLDRSKKDGGSAEGLFTLIFEKTEDGWKIVVDHTT